MFATVLVGAMIAFAIGTRYIARRLGIADGILHRPTGNPYNDAPASRKLPQRSRIQSHWTRYSRYYR
jgi:hypothetical protein